MNRFLFRYESTVTFSAPVTAHSLLLRALPRQEQFQRTEWDSLRLEALLPDGRSMTVPVRIASDAFGNRIQYGCILPPHIRLSMMATGRTVQTPYRICGTAHGMYSASTTLTLPAGWLLEAAQDAKALLASHGLDAKSLQKTGSASCHMANSPTAMAARILSSAVHSHMTYAPGNTNVTTTASEAFELGKGVCQDYAHITLALLRHVGIPARYVCGFLPGEGATHAWVEFFANGVWLAHDPTHDRNVDMGYIKVAHGRDSSDCPVNRGIFTGKVEQRNSVSIKVESV
ncbi:MAG: transglutaminase family protein [Mailhella sp.]|nr:transglutaminase family protein [Mailhella sp.]